MVEINKKSQDRTELLQKRVNRLVRELDEMEKNQAELLNLYRKALYPLASLAREHAPASLEGPIEDLQKALSARKVDSNRLALIVENLGKALMLMESEPDQDQKKCTDSDYDLASRDIFLGAINVLTSLGPADPGTPLGRAMIRLKKAVVTHPVDTKAVEQASQAVKEALLSDEDEPSQRGLKKQMEDPKAHPKLLLGWKMVNALLKGMRAGDQFFDNQVERVLTAVNQFQRTGELDRPALALAGDLMEQFRNLLEERHTEALEALEDVLNEVIRLRTEFSNTMAQAGEQLLDEGERQHSHFQSSMDQMTQDIDQAEDLDQIKSVALDRLSDLRRDMDQATQRQAGIVNLAMEELEQERAALKQAESKVKAAKERGLRLARSALTDPLSGVWNQRALVLWLNQMPVCNQGSPLSMLMFTVDDFHRLAKAWGGMAADRALANISKHVLSILGESDKVFRYTTSEFVVVMQMSPLEKARLAADGVRSCVKNINFNYLNLPPISLTATVAFGQCAAGEEPASLLARLELLLDETKKTGKDMIVASS
jgi:diguanylate cyclase (GGDEF)-like protein